MGYWTTNKQGYSFAENTDGPEMLWGDPPADIMGDAIDEIIAVFVKDVGRKPTVDELVAGVLFSAEGALEDYPQ